MSPEDMTLFQQAIDTANTGQKQAAYEQFSRIHSHGNTEDVTLLYWIAFTTPSPLETQRATDTIAHLEPNHPKLQELRAYQNRKRQQRSWTTRHPRWTVTLAIIAAIVLLSLSIRVVNAVRQRSATTPQQLAESTTISGHNISANLIDTQMIIDETLSTEWDNSVYQTDIMQDCFELQKAFWQRYNDLSLVQVAVEGPIKSRYGGDTTGIFGSCTMNSATARLVHWDQLDYRQAWDAHTYDFEGFSPAISSIGMFFS
jgi:hypothetical protein